MHASFALRLLAISVSALCLALSGPACSGESGGTAELPNGNNGGGLATQTPGSRGTTASAIADTVSTPDAGSAAFTDAGQSTPGADAGTTGPGEDGAGSPAGSDAGTPPTSEDASGPPPAEDTGTPSGEDSANPCVPECTAKACGNDGCGGSCGVCSEGTSCSPAGQCECVPTCAGLECGDDGCGGSCGDCGPNGSCDNGSCTCTPDCNGKLCGDDGCGGACGACGQDEYCSPAGTCECAPNCVGKVCGDDGCGGECGGCPAGQSCTQSGQCIDAAPYVPGGLGTYCGASETCAAEIPDPISGLMVPNAAWPDCMNLACDSGFCTGPGLPGVALLTAATCSKSCVITVDNVNNATGLPGADGVEDPGAPSDCTGFANGPLGAEWHCVNFGVPGSPANSFCMPGTTYQACDAGTECPAGEGCVITTMGGLGQRCFAKTQSGEWGESAMMTTQCNEDPYDGDISICEQGICYTMLGCSSFCETSLDCDTTQLFEDTGCDGATNTCKGWPSKNCLSDADCSAWYCNDPAPLFSNIPEYTPQLCFPNVCDTVSDCPEDFYCRWFYNGEPGALADWEHRCLARDPEGVGLGEPCDSDPTDNIPGDTCEAEDLCVGGYCSAICESDAECGEEQVCRVEVVDLDTDGDTIADTTLPLSYCITLPGKDGPCKAEATCTDAQTCNLYETMVEGDDTTLTVGGYCQNSEPEWGTLGQSCGAAGAEVERCEGFCLGANETAGILGLCTQSCESHTDCPDTTVEGVPYTFRCQTYVYSYGLDAEADEDNLYVGLCVPNALGSSGADCSAELTCAAENEACNNLSITFGPDYAPGTDYVCLDTTNNGTYTPTKGLGEACNPFAAQDECKTMYCLADDTGATGVCTAPCDPANDQCPAGMACTEEVTYPRTGAYADNSGSLWRCETDTSCTPNCAGLACGDDGCGGSCGSCAEGEGCEAGACVAAAATAAVEIVGYAFVPADIEVSVGTTVTWTNSDADPHSVKSMAEDGSIDASGPLDGPLLSQGETFEYTFESPGLYPYRCGPHAMMIGSVTVTE